MFRLVPLWLADPTQAPVPSWLTSPTVALLGFAAMVISLLQAVASVGKWFMKRTEKLSTRRRLVIIAALLCFIADAILSPLTWSTIVAIDAKADPLWQAELYPVITTASAFAGAFFLLHITAEMGWRAVTAPILLIVIGLGFPAFVYAYNKTSILDLCLIASIPVLGIAAAVFAAVAQRRPDAQNADAEDADADADDSSVVAAGNVVLLGSAIGSPATTGFSPSSGRLVATRHGDRPTQPR